MSQTIRSPLVGPPFAPLDLASGGAHVKKHRALNEVSADKGYGSNFDTVQRPGSSSLHCLKSIHTGRGGLWTHMYLCWK